MECADLSAFVADAAKKYQTIVLKLDVEGAEYDILEKMLEDRTLEVVNLMYCEFHADRMNVLPERHEAIVQRLKQICEIHEWDALPFSLRSDGKSKERAEKRREVLLRSIASTRRRYVPSETGKATAAEALLEPHVLNLLSVIDVEKSTNDDLSRQLSERKQVVSHQKAQIVKLRKATATLNTERERLLQKRNRLKKIAIALAIPYAILTLPVSLALYVFVTLTRKRKSKLNRTGGVAGSRISEIDVLDDLGFKLETLGFADPAIRELEVLSRGAKDRMVRAKSARKLALHSMRRKEESGYRAAIAWLRQAREEKTGDKEFLATLATAELLCRHFLGETTEGEATYERARRDGHATPDVTLAWVNYQVTADARLAAVNEALKPYV